MVEDRVRVVRDERSLRFLAWALSLDDQAREFLLAEATRELISTQRELESQNARVTAIVGWALIGVGTLLVAAGQEAIDLVGSPETYPFLVGCAMTFIFGTLVLAPKTWTTGVNVEWYRGFDGSADGPETGELKAFHFFAISEQTTSNQAVLARRHWYVVGGLLGLTLEFAALVSVVGRVLLSY